MFRSVIVHINAQKMDLATKVKSEKSEIRKTMTAR